MKSRKVTRDRNGRWVSHETRMKREVRNFKVFVGSIVLAGILATGTNYYNKPQRVEAETTYYEHIENEEIEIYEIADVPKNTPLEVGMHFIESDTALLKAFHDNDLVAVEEELEKRHAYVRALAILHVTEE